MDNTFDLLELNQKYRMQIIALRNQAINLESAIGENEKKICKDNNWYASTGFYCWF